jgi:hypothetical protein
MRIAAATAGALLAALGGVAAAQTVVIPPPAPAPVVVAPSDVRQSVTSPAVAPITRVPPAATTTVVTTTPGVPQTVTISKVYVPQGAINTAVEQPAPWAPAPPGSVIETSAGTRVVKVVNNYDVVYEVDGVRRVSHGMFLEGDEGGWAGRNAVPQLWPLQAGKQVSYSVDAERGTRHDVIRVLRTEVIGVPAGTFYTYVVERRERPPLTSAERVTTMWYAPSVGAVVKQEEAMGELSRKPTVRYEMTRMQMPAALPGAVVIASTQRPDTPEMQAQYCRERGTTVRTSDGRTVALDCSAFIQIDRANYAAWLGAR